MPTKLKDLVITKVALVDEGSCSAAHIKLYKRKDEGGNVMNFEEIMKSLTKEQQDIINAEVEKAKTVAKTKAEADVEDALDGGVDDAMENPDGTPKKDTKKKSVAKVAAKIKELNAEIAKLKEDPADKSEEDLLKNVDPSIRALIEKSNAKAAAAETAIKKMKDEADEKEALLKAKELPNIGAKTEDLAKSFKELKNFDAKLFDNLFGVMKAANELISSGSSLDEIGKSASADESVAKAAADVAWGAIEKKAEEIKKSANCSKEQAISKAIRENGSLYQEYLKNLK